MKITGDEDGDGDDDDEDENCLNEDRHLWVHDD